MRNIILISCLLIISCSFSQKEIFSTKGNKFHYSVRYINETGDTIIRDKMVMEITGKRWFVQPRVQNLIIYQYDTDTNEFKNYVDPELFHRERNQKIYEKKKRYNYDEKEKTGLRIEDSLIYFHPPRINQYRMLFYAPHPFFWFPSMEKKQFIFDKDITIYGMGRFIHNHTVDSLGIQSFNNESIKLWKVNVASTLEAKTEYFNTEKEKYASELNALFSKEYGFIQLFYHFKNGVKIEFELEKMEHN